MGDFYKRLFYLVLPCLFFFAITAFIIIFLEFLSLDIYANSEYSRKYLNTHGINPVAPIAMIVVPLAPLVGMILAAIMTFFFYKLNHKLKVILLLMVTLIGVYIVIKYNEVAQIIFDFL